ncbi:alpha-L-rhamnosidase C-terminal domain-containing protein [Edaphobacter sp. 12200R-103]|uniref:alpha-L-rhamnosidase-related protein n=1 Tax=Edaphobacter sp. 12200R-103 TaxID=2703788 RepID=UPI001EE4B711|nr:alpha-L-rhamnosidase C-terminal domain-containing protein [Edaphobacter sp. 12200R-103]
MMEKTIAHFARLQRGAVLKLSSAIGVVGALLALSSAAAFGQDLPLTAGLRASQLSPIDPARDVASPQLEGAHHTPLTEEYIWTANDSTAAQDKLIYKFPGLMEQTEPHYFRHSFSLSIVPPQPTLYIAGPRSVKVWLNGSLAESVESDTSSPLGMHTFAIPIAKFLKAGKNIIAIEAIRGRGVTGFANSPLVRQQTFGQVLVAKILPAAEGVETEPLMISSRDWKSSISAQAGWQNTSFDDSLWKPVQSIGAIESDIELFQWNADAGLYDWPGYDGISKFLAHMPLPATQILATYTGRGSFSHPENLTSGKDSNSFTVALPSSPLTDAEAPSLFLDFGRELTGRVEIVSDSDTPVTVSIQMGESESEALKNPYLGINQLTIPPHGTGHGPKSAFRYAKIRFLGGGPKLCFKAIHVDHIYYPVQYLGSFESSDKMLNRIWEIGAYTAHLCMQDGVWDASKRDRGRWMGDMDVSGRVIEDVFGERSLMEDTLDRLMGSAPVDQHVNGIPGYSAFWFTGVADYYRHTGSKKFLEREHGRMLQLLHYVDQEFDVRGIYANRTKVWLYVDWSPDLNGDTPETRRATTLEYYRAYREAAWLLRELGDTSNADQYTQKAEHIKAAADKYLLDSRTDTFGPRWQTNAAAVVGGMTDAVQSKAIWNHVLSSVGHIKYNAYIISPYYNYYVIRSMAKVGHRQAALDWIRQYWGGMVEEGATSMWEAYDPSWYKEDFHASLQADNRSGYFVSLAHGWSAGPTAWLMEEVLGIEPTGAGFNTVDIRPDLLDMQWAKGAEPTPHGLLKVEARKEANGTTVTLDIPQGVTARVLVPSGSSSAKLLVNGIVRSSTDTEDGMRKVITLGTAGHYDLEAE